MSDVFSDTVDIALTVNGEPVEARVPAGRHLIDLLRLDCGLTGAHAGCEHGVCGACTVRVDGEAVRGCLMLWWHRPMAPKSGPSRASPIVARSRDLQHAFVARNALQCGFCTPGMLVAAEERLARGAVPTRSEIGAHLSGNYCRCTG